MTRQRTFRAVVPEELPVLRPDNQRLRHKFLNLLSDLVKFTPLGDNVTLKIRSQPDSGSVFQAIHTGVRFEIQDVPRVFAPVTLARLMDRPAAECWFV